MEEVGSTKLKHNMPKYLDMVNAGARFIVTEHGKPVAKLLPIEEGDTIGTPLDKEEILVRLKRKGMKVPSKEMRSKPFNLPEPVLCSDGFSASDWIIKNRR